MNVPLAPAAPTRNAVAALLASAEEARLRRRNDRIVRTAVLAYITLLGALAVVFGVLEVVSGRKFWFPLAGVFLISFFLLTFYPFLMRKLGGISSDLLMRQSRRVQSVLSDFARKLPESSSLGEIARIESDRPDSAAPVAISAPFTALSQPAVSVRLAISSS